MATTSSRASRADATDERHLQEKALERWERQKRVWDRVRNNVLQRTGPVGGGASLRNFNAASTARARQEDYNMFTAALPATALEGTHTWESALRTNDPSEAVRYVAIGKGYPYVLYGELRDPTALPADHPSYTRVITADDPAATDGNFAGREAARGTVRSVLEASKGDKRKLRELTTKATRRSLSDDPAATAGGDWQPQSERAAEDAYFQQQLFKYAPYIQQKFAHFLVPRQYMEVVGQPAPRLRPDELQEAAAGTATGSSAAAPFAADDGSGVQHFPPPTQVRMASSAGSRRTTAATAVGAAGAGAEAAGEGEEEGAALEDDADGDADGTRTPPPPPPLTLSTRQLHFCAHPGGLAHAHVTISNPGSVTYYYSWVPVDRLREAEEEALAELGPPPAADAPEEEHAAYAAAREPWHVHRQFQRASAHTRLSRNLFLMSRPANGVLLPGAAEPFAFSFRSPTPGCMHQTLELLTIPPSAERLLLDLSAVVITAERPASVLARPVEEALQRRLAVDAQRQVIADILADPTPFEADALQRRIYETKEKKERREAEAKEAVEAKRRAWVAANQHTFDGVPFNLAVYDRFGDLHANLKRTLAALGTPMPEAEQWRGSLTLLLARLMDLKDTVARTLLYETAMVLLRAARVAEAADTDLDTLLARAADALAAHVDGRLAAVQRQEAAFSQIPRDAATAAAVAAEANAAAAGAGAGAGGAGAGGGGGGSGGPSGGGRKRASMAAKKSISPGNSGRGGGAKDSGEPAAPVLGSLRAELVPTVPPPPRDRALLEGELRALERLRAQTVEEGHAERRDAFLAHFREMVDVGCSLPLLEVVQAARADDIRTIQHCERIPVDKTVELVQPKPATGRKK